MTEFGQDEKQFQQTRLKLVADLKSGRGADFETVLNEKRLCDDKEVVLLILEHGSGSYLEKMSPRLQDDEEVVLCACASDRGNDPYALRFASQRLKSDKDFLINLFNHVMRENLDALSRSGIPEEIQDEVRKLSKPLVRLVRQE